MSRDTHWAEWRSYVERCGFTSALANASRALLMLEKLHVDEVEEALIMEREALGEEISDGYIYTEGVDYYPASREFHEELVPTSEIHGSATRAEYNPDMDTSRLSLA